MVAQNTLWWLKIPFGGSSWRLNDVISGTNLVPIFDSLLLLSKLPLIEVDMFLFNDVRATSVETEPCYNLLEMIKDGRAVSSKYLTKALRFKVPNVVMVFSNVYPDTKQLSRDRWDVYNITEKGLDPVSTKKCTQYLL